MPGQDQLALVDHIVVLMLENRSFDHLLGFLYADTGNQSPTGQPFEGLTGVEANPDGTGAAVPVFKIDPAARYAYYMPGANPGEGYSATNLQLFGADPPPMPPVATNHGFVTNFAATLAWERTKPGRAPLPGTTPASIMGMHTPATLPVLSGLARGFAVCDHWFSSVPSETMPNRTFACAGTSLGSVDDKTHRFNTPSIFGLLTRHGLDWAIYGYNTPPLTRLNFPDTLHAANGHFGEFPDFRAATTAGRLPPFTFLEPDFSATGNDQHAVHDVARGEQLIHDVYTTLRSGPAWAKTLLIITYDEHGGCYDHVPPPTRAVAPDGHTSPQGFTFTRFGVRVPAILVSPLIDAGTVFRVPAGTVPLDHTAILKTVERRWGLPALTARDGAAPDLAGALTRTTPRSDDPLQGVGVPRAHAVPRQPAAPSHLQQIHAALVAELPLPGETQGSATQLASLRTSADYAKYIRRRTAAWASHRERTE